MDYTTKEAAVLLGINQRSVDKAINRGHIITQRRGRMHFITQDEIERYRREHKGHKPRVQTTQQDTSSL